MALVLQTLACSNATNPDNAAALRDIAAGQAGRQVVVEGTVTRVMPTAAGPSGVHERFILLISQPGRRVPVFVADNISIASAAPIHRGDHVIVKGELAFNGSGPVIHWTHRDPRFRHPPGFISVGGKIYE
ncbi:MAG: hypothetical protein DLM53_02090 [Candidatus Eremiobacter antarcticus]|nr:MAG: hypothetical protein DLM53_02090 [Candidatus Eremiobacter sp. RRmetagenome_bin22]